MIEKTSINLVDWEIISGRDYLFLVGEADNHPKLGRKVRLSHTSPIIAVGNSENENELIFETENSKYICNWKFVRLGHRDFKLTKTKGVPGDVVYNKFIDVLNYINKFEIEGNKEYIDEITKIIELSTIGKKELQEERILENKRLISEADKYSNCIYLEVSNISEGDTLAYNVRDEKGVIKPLLHVGMFQDSVLYMKDDLVDFRYFPRGMGLEIYSWSDNIECLRVKNMKNYDITVDKQIIRPGETVIIDNNNYNCGLISLNCVDGKSILLN